MAQLTRPDLHGEIDVRFPDNTTALITPPIVRAFLHNLVDSALLAATDKSSFASLLGVPADNAALAAVLAGKASKQELADLIGAAPAALDTLAELAAQLLADEQGAAAILATLQQHTQQISANSSLISSLIANKLEAASLRQVSTLDAARNAIANATLTAGASYTVLGLWNGASGGVALLAGSRNAFHPIGFIGDSSGNATAVVASVVAGTFELLSDYVKRLAGSGGGGNVSVDGVTIVQDGAGVISAVVRNDLVFRTTIGGQQTSGPYYISRLEAGNYQSQNTNPGVLNYSVSVNGAVVAGARFSLAENDVLVVNYQADVNGAVFTLRTI